MDPTTYLLWFGPFVLLLGGLLLLFRYVKQRRELIVEQPLFADERRRAEALLKTSGKRLHDSFLADRGNPGCHRIGVCPATLVADIAANLAWRR